MKKSLTWVILRQGLDDQSGGEGMSKHPRLIEWTQPGQEREVGMKEKAKVKIKRGKFVCACRCVCVDVEGCAWTGMLG